MIHVVIPTHQRPQYLRSILSDLSHQIYIDFDVRVCSDGFERNVKSLVVEFNNKFPGKYKYLHTTYHTNDWGRSPRELGLFDIDDDMGYMCFIDDDNTISKKYLHTLSKVLQTSSILAFGQVYLADPEINGERIVPTGPLQSGTIYSYGYIDPLCMIVQVAAAKRYFKYWKTQRDGDYTFIEHLMYHYTSIFFPEVIAVHR